MYATTVKTAAIANIAPANQMKMFSRFFSMIFSDNVNGVRHLPFIRHLLQPSEFRCWLFLEFSYDFVVSHSVVSVQKFAHGITFSLLAPANS